MSSTTTQGNIRIVSQQLFMVGTANFNYHITLTTIIQLKGDSYFEGMHSLFLCT
jgi:hypothetical protein